MKGQPLKAMLHAFAHPLRAARQVADLVDKVADGSLDCRTEEGMTKSCASTGCWADIFEHGVFQGKMTRLRLGKHIDLKMPGSMIVGPRASVRWAKKKGARVLVLPPRKVVPDFGRGRGWSPTTDIEIIPAASGMDPPQYLKSAAGSLKRTS
jgi:hypothetical protein